VAGVTTARRHRHGVISCRHADERRSRRGWTYQAGYGSHHLVLPSSGHRRHRQAVHADDACDQGSQQQQPAWREHCGRPAEAISRSSHDTNQDSSSAALGPPVLLGRPGIAVDANQ
jgi:hypothetical protein